MKSTVSTNYQEKQKMNLKQFEQAQKSFMEHLKIIGILSGSSNQSKHQQYIQYVLEHVFEKQISHFENIQDFDLSKFLNICILQFFQLLGPQNLETVCENLVFSYISKHHQNKFNHNSQNTDQKESSLERKEITKSKSQDSLKTNGRQKISEQNTRVRQENPEQNKKLIKNKDYLEIQVEENHTHEGAEKLQLTGQNKLNQTFFSFKEKNIPNSSRNSEKKQKKVRFEVQEQCISNSSIEMEEIKLLNLHNSQNIKDKNFNFQSNREVYFNNSSKIKEKKDQNLYDIEKKNLSILKENNNYYKSQGQIESTKYIIIDEIKNCRPLSKGKYITSGTFQNNRFSVPQSTYNII